MLLVFPLSSFSSSLLFVFHLGCYRVIVSLLIHRILPRSDLLCVHAGASSRQAHLRLAYGHHTDAGQRDGGGVRHSRCILIDALKLGHAVVVVVVVVVVFVFVVVVVALVFFFFFFFSFFVFFDFFFFFLLFLCCFFFLRLLVLFF
jgi:hypothetical protein